MRRRFSALTYIGTALAFGLLTGCFQEHAPSVHKIIYKATGSDDWVKDHPDGEEAFVDIRMRNQSGGEDHFKGILPWSRDDEVKSGDFVAFSVQLDRRDETSVTCQIFLDGQLVKESHSSGEFAMADCSGRI